MTRYDLFYKQACYDQRVLILAGKYFRPFGQVVHEHNGIFISFAAWWKLDNIDSHSIKWARYRYWRQERMNGLSNLPSSTHLTCSTPPNYISSHGWPPKMLRQLAVNLSTAKVFTKQSTVWILK